MAFAPGVDIGTLKLIPEADRPSTWTLSGVRSTAAWTTTTAFRAYRPAGTKAYLLQCAVVFTGDGAVDGVEVYLRKTGSGVAAGDTQCTKVDLFHTNLGAGLTAYANRQVVVMCDANGDIDYYGPVAAGAFYAVLHGYYL